MTFAMSLLMKLALHPLEELQIDVENGSENIMKQGRTLESTAMAKHLCKYSWIQSRLRYRKNPNKPKDPSD